MSATAETKVIASVSGKGGVGKSFTTVNLGIEYAVRYPEKRVLIIDLCQNSDVSAFLKKDRDDFIGNSSSQWLLEQKKISEVIQEHEDFDNLFFLPSDNELYKYKQHVESFNNPMKAMAYLRKRLETLKGTFDLILLDTHPSENDILTQHSIISSDHVLIPTGIHSNEVNGAARMAEILEEFKEEGLSVDWSIVLTRMSNKGNKTQRVEDIKDVFKERSGIELDEQRILGQMRFSDVVNDNSVKKEKFLLREINSKYIQNLIGDIQEILNNLEVKLGGK